MRGMHGRICRGREPELVYENRNRKFAEEKLCAGDETLFIQFDGILLDRRKPQEEGERFALLSGLYAAHGRELAARLRGSFNLVIYDKTRRGLLLSNDLLGKRALYYCALEDGLFYAESYYDLLALLAEEGRELDIDREGVRSMIETGALTGNHTYLRQVRYLDAYESLWVDLESGKTEVVRLRPELSSGIASREEALATFDRLFTAAVERQFAKNAEYGYRQYLTLSGGMDSRACLLQGIKNGYRDDIVCFTYAQSGSVDQQVSQQIAVDYGLDLLYYPLDGAVFLSRLAESMDRNECQQSGDRATGAGTMAQLLNMTRVGVLHTGLCGGELMGDLIEMEPGGTLGRIRQLEERFGWKGRGKFFLRRRSYLDNLRLCHNSSSMYIRDCEVISPFLDEDVVSFVSSLEPEWLFWRSFYREWMGRYLPNDYMTTNFYGPIDISPARELGRKTAAHVKKKLFGVSRREMNPMDYWMSRNEGLRLRTEKEFAEGCAWLREHGCPEDLIRMAEEGWTPDGYRRFAVLTALRALRDLESIPTR